MDEKSYKAYRTRFERAADSATIISTAREYFDAGGSPGESLSNGTVFSLVLEADDDSLTEHVLSTFDRWSGFERQLATSAAVAAGNATVLNKLLKLGARAKLKKGYLPHVTAAANNHSFDCVDVLLEHGASLDDRCPSDWTPLHWAASSGDERAAQLLIERGADPDAIARDGNKEVTVLQLAQERGHAGVVRLLLAQGVEPDAGTADALQPAPGRAMELATSEHATPDQPVDWPMVIAFHAPIILLGAPLVMPALFALLSATDLIGEDLARSLQRLDYTQLLTFGAMSLVPSVYAYGTRLRFSGGRFLVAAAFIAFISIQAMATAMRSGSTLPVSLGGGILGVLVASLLGGAGLAIYNVFNRPSAEVAVEDTLPDPGAGDQADEESKATDAPHPLFAELVEIGSVPNNPNGVADEIYFWRRVGEGVGPHKLWDARTREIGEELYDEGSHSLELMRRAHTYVVQNLGELAGHALSAHWHCIGENSESGEMWMH